ncbi:MAG TPA: UDP-2,3-diacylglucosamine diphosphatase [Symbiobacteriaceae bacterium]|nr:UDP-2,3-diacylglucosamine diphosphatase [Symbiobacteriaceae bacterium]
MADEIVYFVSDTHLGDGTGADRFLYPQQLMNLLARIEAEPNAHLVLLGDLMELWATTLEPILVRHATVFNAIGRIAAKHRVTYVVGNHDCLPWYYFVGQGSGNFLITDRMTAARGTLVALHGHQYDPFNQVKITTGHVKAPWTRRLVQVVGFVGRVGGEAAGEALADAGTMIDKAVASVEALLPGGSGEPDRQTLAGFLQHARGVFERESPGERGYPAGEQAYDAAARSLMRGGARFVVMGHTHHPLIHTYGNRVYVNTGSWVWDQYPPTYARFADGRLELLEANTHQPYRPGPARRE